MTTEQLKSLEDIGFTFTWCVGQENGGRVSTESDEKWQGRYGDLKEYNKLNKHTNTNMFCNMTHVV